MKRFYLAAIAMALLLSACGGPAAEVTPTLSPAAEPTAAPVSTPTPTPDPTPAPTAVVLVAPELTEQRFSQEFTAEDGTVVLSVDYALPHVVNYPDSAALLAIDDRYTQMGAALLDNAASTAQDAVSDYEVSLQAGLPFQPTIEEMSYEVTFLSERVLSVSRTFYAAAAGAAHPTVLLLGAALTCVTAGGSPSGTSVPTWRAPPRRRWRRSVSRRRWPVWSARRRRPFSRISFT